MNGRAGLSTAISNIEQEIKRRLLEAEKKTSKGSKPFLVLDDFDTIFRHTTDHHTSPSEIINKLLGMVESLQQKGYAVGIIAIVNESLADIDLDDRIRSRIETLVIQFPQYTKEELIDILQDRNKRAFGIASVNFKVIEACAEICCSQYGDARRAINLFKAAVDKSFSVYGFSPSCVDTSHIHEAANLMFEDNTDILDVISRLPVQQRILVGLIAWLVTEKNCDRQSGSEIYNLYKRYIRKVTFENPSLMPQQEQSMLSVLQPRRIRQLLEELEAKHIIQSVKTSKGRSKGVEKLYSLNVHPPSVIAIGLGHLWGQIISAKNNLAELDRMEKLVDAPVYLPEYRALYKNWIHERKKEVNNKIHWDKS